MSDLPKANVVCFPECPKERSDCVFRKGMVTNDQPIELYDREGNCIKSDKLVVTQWNCVQCHTAWAQYQHGDNRETWGPWAAR